MRRASAAQVPPATVDRDRAGRTRAAALAAGSPRRAVRAGRQGRLPLERRHERRARPGRRCLGDRARIAAAARARRAGAPGDPRRRATARRRRGLRHGRCRRDRRVRLRGREPRARSGRRGHRPGQQLRRGGQARRRRRRGHGCRGRRDRDPHRRRRHRRPRPGRGRPDQPGRARRAGLRRAGHGIRGASPPPCRAEIAPRAARTRHAERVAAALAGPQSAIVLVDDLDGGDRVQQRLRARAPRAAPRRPGPGRVRPRRRGVRRPRLAGEPR